MIDLRKRGRFGQRERSTGNVSWGRGIRVGDLMVWATAPFCPPRSPSPPDRGPGQALTSPVEGSLHNPYGRVLLASVVPRSPFVLRTFPPRAGESLAFCKGPAERERGIVLPRWIPAFRNDGLSPYH